MAAACAAGFWFHDAKGPGRPGVHHSDIRLPDFSVEGLGAKMSVVRGQDRVATLRLALKALGGIETFIKKTIGFCSKSMPLLRLPPCCRQRPIRKLSLK